MTDASDVVTSETTAPSIATLERRGIEYVTLGERWGKPANLFWMWAGAIWNVEFLVYGVLGIVVFGLSFPQAVAVHLAHHVARHRDDGQLDLDRRGSRALPRREECADQTRAAVIAAARRLFAEIGFFQTNIEQIAKLSRVSPATVYAQCGGKQGLLRSLMDSWTQAPMVVETQQKSLAAADAARVMQTLGTAYLQITRQWGDVLRMVIDVAAHDHESGAVLATAQRRHNRHLATICRHLEDIGALRDDVDARLASQEVR